MILVSLRRNTQRLLSWTSFYHSCPAGTTPKALRSFANTQRRPPVGRPSDNTSTGPMSATTLEEAPKSLSAAMLPMAIVPVMFIMYGISEHFLTNRQLRLNEELRQQFAAEHQDIQNEGARPFLFYCVIRRTRGLTHSISNIQVGDVVEVLEEGVGPNNEYNLCRFPAPLDQPHAMDSVGWFPIRWLQKLEDYERIAQRLDSSMAGSQKD